MKNIFYKSFLLFIGIFFVVLVLQRNIFPSFSYYKTKADNHGIMVLEKVFENESYFLVSTLGAYPFNQLKVKFNINNEIKKQDFQIVAVKDYLANSYPIGPEINSEEQLRGYLFFDNNTELPNGSLISFDQSVYVLSRGKYLPIIGPEVFESLGYNWDFVKPVDGGVINKLSQGERLNYMAIHPDGTILKTKEGKLFLIWQEQKLPITDEEILYNLWKDYIVIMMEGETPKFSSVCKDPKLKVKELSCNLDISEQKDKLGQGYIIKLTPELKDIKEIRTTFNTTLNFDKAYWKYVMGKFKQQLAIRYGEIF